MSLATDHLGLAGQTAFVSLKLVDDWTEIQRQYLEQQKNQTLVSAIGAKGSSEAAYESIKQDQAITQQDANKQFAAGALQIGGQAGGYLHGLKLNGQLNTAVTQQRNAQATVERLERAVPLKVGVGRAAPAGLQANGFAPFTQRNGVNIGEPLVGQNAIAVDHPPSMADKDRAIKLARDQKTHIEKQVSSLQQQKDQYYQHYTTIFQAFSSVSQGIGDALKNGLYAIKAQQEAAKVGADFLNNTAQALENQINGYISSAKERVTSAIQLTDALAQADNARLGG